MARIDSSKAILGSLSSSQRSNCCRKLCGAQRFIGVFVFAAGFWRSSFPFQAFIGTRGRAPASTVGQRQAENM